MALIIPIPYIIFLIYIINGIYAISDKTKISSTNMLMGMIYFAE